MGKGSIKFSIVVGGAPYGSQSASSAYQFCIAALAAGHQVAGVFFYQEGVLNASQLISPPSDEVNLPELWAKLAIKYRLINHVKVNHVRYYVGMFYLFLIHSHRLIPRLTMLH